LAPASVERKHFSSDFGRESSGVAVIAPSDEVGEPEVDCVLDVRPGDVARLDLPSQVTDVFRIALAVFGAIGAPAKDIAVRTAADAGVSIPSDDQLATRGIGNGAQDGLGFIFHGGMVSQTSDTGSLSTRQQR
jgi:hypothetical protein